MLGTLKKHKSSEVIINRQLHNTIYKKVTKKEHKHPSPQSEKDRTLKECIELFNKGADPNVLIELEKSLREQKEYYKYYIDNFLPALKTKVIESEKLTKPSVLSNEGKSSQRSPTIKGKILRIIAKITIESSDKDLSISTIQNQKNHQTDRRVNDMRLFKNKSFSNEVACAESSGSSALERGSLAKGVSGKGIPGTYNTLRNSGYYGASTVPTSEQSQARKEIAQSQLNGSFSQSCEDLKNKDPSTTADAVEVLSVANTSKLSSSNDSDSEINSPGLVSSSRRSSLTSVTSNSSEESVSTTLSSTEESNGLQPKDEGETKLAHLTKTRPKGPSGRRPSSKYREKSEVKQPNNRNLHVAFVAGCALSTIGCIVAGAMTSGLVGAAVLFATAAVFAIAAAVELYSNVLSSKLTSISVSPLIDNKELTA